MMIVALTWATISCAGGQGDARPELRQDPGSTVASGTGEPDPTAAVGDTIVISSDGFRPAWLLTSPGTIVTFRNQSSRTWSVVFDHQGVRSGPIPPGKTFSWRSATPISVTYHAGNDPSTHGAIQVQSV